LSNDELAGLIERIRLIKAGHSRGVATDGADGSRA
jgi:hypothetical protein